MAMDDGDIRQLERDAAEAGDDEMVRHCRCALGGDAASRAAIERTVGGWHAERVGLTLREEQDASRLAATIVRGVMA